MYNKLYTRVYNSHKILKINTLSQLVIGSRRIIYSQKNSQPVGYQGVQLWWLCFHKAVLWIFSFHPSIIKSGQTHLCLQTSSICFGKAACQREGACGFIRLFKHQKTVLSLFLIFILKTEDSGSNIPNNLAYCQLNIIIS